MLNFDARPRRLRQLHTRRRPPSLPHLRAKTFLAATRSGSAGAEENFLFLPGGIQCFQIVWLGIRLSEQCFERRLVGLRICKREQCAKDRLIRRFALRKSLSQRRNDMRRLADQAKRILRSKR